MPAGELRAARTGQHGARLEGPARAWGLRASGTTVWGTGASSWLGGGLACVIREMAGVGWDMGSTGARGGSIVRRLSVVKLQRYFGRSGLFSPLFSGPINAQN